jgi:4-diphosphocytidyl-2-C-methyl-D-erythritol kinase
MNRHFGDVVSMRDLVRIAAAIGKDVPFFLTGAAACLARGAGEVLRPLPGRIRAAVLLVAPDVNVATGEAYAALADHVRFTKDPARRDRSAAMVRAIATGDVDAVSAALYNDFEVLVERRHPVVREVRQALLAFGARGAAMSGSGPTTFGLFASASALAGAEAGIARHFPAFAVMRG